MVPMPPSSTTNARRFTCILFFKITLLILFVLFLAALGLCCYAQSFPSCGERGLLFIAVCGLLIVVASPCCGARALGAWASVVVASGLSSCGSRALERRLSSCCALGLVALQHVGSSRTRARTCVPCIGRWILNNCATREALHAFLIFPATLRGRYTVPIL